MMFSLKDIEGMEAVKHIQRQIRGRLTQLWQLALELMGFAGLLACFALLSMMQTAEPPAEQAGKVQCQYAHPGSISISTLTAPAAAFPFPVYLLLFYRYGFNASIRGYFLCSLCCYISPFLRNSFYVFISIHAP